jgi:hypothetical protein
MVPKILLIPFHHCILECWIKISALGYNPDLKLALHPTIPLFNILLSNPVFEFFTSQWQWRRTIFANFKFILIMTDNILLYSHNSVWLGFSSKNVINSCSRSKLKKNIKHHYPCICLKTVRLLPFLKSNKKIANKVICFFTSTWHGNVQGKDFFNFLLIK